MVAYTMLRVPSELTLVEVTPQPFYRGNVILALDVRRHFLILSQTMSGIRECIEEVANQPVSETSLYESCRRQLRRGLTHGSWSITKLPAQEAIQQYNTIRRTYTQRVIAARSASQWKFAKGKVP